MNIFNFARKVVSFLEGKTSAKVNGPSQHNPYLTIGNSLLFKNFSLKPRLAENRIYVRVGNDSMVGGTYTFESGTGEIIIGDRVYIAGGNFICINKIEVESDVFISWGCYFFDNDSHSIDYRHRLTDMKNHLDDWRSGKPNFNISKDWSNVNSSPVRVCRYAWIGMECKILKGVTIGEGAVVGSGSVITKDVEPWTIVGGNPSKLVKIIPEELRKK